MSARSAALGHVIETGGSRWYFVAYRDPLAYCPVVDAFPAVHTLSLTQTGKVTWMP